MFRAHQETQNRLLLADVSDAWSTFDNPKMAAPLITENTFSTETTNLLKKGRKFAELAYLGGLSPSAKRARAHYHRAAGEFEGGINEYYSALDKHNLFVLAARNNRLPPSA